MKILPNTRYQYIIIFTPHKLRTTKTHYYLSKEDMPEQQYTKEEGDRLINDEIWEFITKKEYENSTSKFPASRI